VFYKQGVISAYIIKITRKVEQNNGKENVVPHKFRGISYPRKSGARYT
jgi:hypothetical protein